MVDQSLDISGAVQWELLQLYPAPPFVKNANHQALIGDTESLPDVAFAGPSKTFPVHTKAAAWLSAAFAAYNTDKAPAEELDAVKNNLRKAAKYWRIEDEVEQLFATHKVAASAAVVHALEYTQDGVLKRAFPMRNSQEVRAAANILQQYHSKLAFDIRQQAASRILDQAVVYCVDGLDNDYLAKQAGYGHAPADWIAEQWHKRAVFVRSTQPEIADQLDMLAQSVLANGSDARDMSVRLKMASVMDGIDETHKLRDLYGTELASPEETMFHITYKAASDLSGDLIPLATGDTFTKTALAKVTSDVLSDWFGQDMLDEVADPLFDNIDLEKLASVAKTLPRGDAATFKLMMHSIDQEPVLHGKQAFAALEG
jgi:hypothetical protein